MLIETQLHEVHVVGYNETEREGRVPLIKQHLWLPAPATLFHCMDQRGFLGMVRQAEMWATSSDCLNDREADWGEDDTVPASAMRAASQMRRERNDQAWRRCGAPFAFLWWSSTIRAAWPA